MEQFYKSQRFGGPYDIVPIQQMYVGCCVTCKGSILIDLIAENGITGYLLLEVVGLGL